MRIAYITHTRFPTEKAHGHQIARVCEALVKLKHDVTIVSPDITNAVSKSAGVYYHLTEEFSEEKLRTFDAYQSKLIPGRFAFLFTMRSYRSALEQFLTEQKFDLLYARSPQVLPALLKTRTPVVLELHTLPRLKKARFAAHCRKCKRIVCLTSPMKEELVALGVPAAKIIVEGDAVDPERFAKLPSTKKAKHHFGVPEDRVVIGYVGSLVTMDKLEKGVDILIKAIPLLRKHGDNVHLLIVGGPEEWIERYRLLAIHTGLTDNDITFYGPVPTKLVPDALAACDVCVYPAPQPKKAFFRRDTSPLKLFEYLAAGKPVVCADIPPVRDVLDKTMVRFVHAGSISSLAGGIRDVLEHPDDAKKRTKKGLAVIKKHTWEKRMKRIIDAISPKTSSSSRGRTRRS